MGHGRLDSILGSYSKMDKIMGKTYRLKLDCTDLLKNGKNGQKISSKT
jgi:hypothetical protein